MGTGGNERRVGLLSDDEARVRAALDIRPYAVDHGDAQDDLWVVSALTPGMDGREPEVSADHVLGVSGASTSLAQLAVRRPVGRALDLGAGSGVQSLHLRRHAQHVVATDVNRRALGLAELTVRLDVAAAAEVLGAVELREGSLFEPVAGERFDLIVSNPPFVISPARSHRLVYRDSGLPGDAVVERIVREAPAHLFPGGWCQVVANWAIEAGRPWEERVAAWLDAACDALVVRREVLDPAAYVALWLADAGMQGRPGYLAAYDAWLGWFQDQGIEAVGFGWVNLRRRTHGTGHQDLLDWPFQVEQPVAPAVAAWADAVDWLADGPDLAAARLVLAPGVRQETTGAPGAADPEVIVLRQDRGLRRARRVGTVAAALVGACDGELTVGAILDAVSDLLGRDPTATRQDMRPVVAELVREGYLLSPAAPR